jgi:hypothetical protein
MKKEEMVKKQIKKTRRKEKIKKKNCMLSWLRLT